MPAPLRCALHRGGAERQGMLLRRRPRNTAAAVPSATGDAMLRVRSATPRHARRLQVGATQAGRIVALAFAILARHDTLDQRSRPAKSARPATGRRVCCCSVHAPSQKESDVASRPRSVSKLNTSALYNDSRRPWCDAARSCSCMIATNPSVDESACSPAGRQEPPSTYHAESLAITSTTSDRQRMQGMRRLCVW